MVVSNVHDAIVGDNTKHFFVGRQFVTNDPVQLGPPLVCPRFGVLQFTILFGLFSFFSAGLPLVISTPPAQIANKCRHRPSIDSNKHRAIRRHTVTIDIFGSSADRSLQGRIIYSVSVHLLDNAPRIRNHHTSCCRRRCRHILLIETRRPRPTLSIERVRRDLVSQLTLV